MDVFCGRIIRDGICLRLQKECSKQISIFGEQYIVIDDSVLTVIDEDQKIIWESYHERVLNTEFVWDLNSLSQADTVSGVPCLYKQGQSGQRVNQEDEDWKSCSTIKVQFQKWKKHQENQEIT